MQAVWHKELSVAPAGTTPGASKGCVALPAAEKASHLHLLFNTGLQNRPPREASQHRPHPAAACIITAHQGAEPSRHGAWSSVGKRRQQEQPAPMTKTRCQLSLEFPSGSPYSAPTVTFPTPCHHPNVDTQSQIGLDILKDKWSVLCDVRIVLLSMQSLLGEPNTDSPLNTHPAELWDNPTAFKNDLLETYSHRPTSQDPTLLVSSPRILALGKTLSLRQENHIRITYSFFFFPAPKVKMFLEIVIQGNG
ncbi:ubiquitin-conjugating enzyme E2 C-like [Echinops telfairi]|uniref:Ubiquitin-conjugating enzyme E2 C-like n=1 Tax=Echinops telfairi TaxID=9371 RepID=A0ABM1VJS0_ECHTE|nr:ubiquitin-conjugating enzyme E2 C-like [Echinops telfairi]